MGLDCANNDILAPLATTGLVKHSERFPDPRSIAQKDL
jgi:hypothetical protein